MLATNVYHSGVYHSGRGGERLDNGSEVRKPKCSPLNEIADHSPPNPLWATAQARQTINVANDAHSSTGSPDGGNPSQPNQVLQQQTHYASTSITTIFFKETSVAHFLIIVRRFLPMQKINRSRQSFAEDIKRGES
jgi:hypothetical protein